jgi:hypothetical protein
VLAQLLAGCQHCLEASPKAARCLRVGLQVMRALWVLLLLEAALHGSLSLMLVSVGAMTATTMLLRLVAVLLQPALRSSLTHAVELQWQLSLLWSSVWNPLPQAHSWSLAFEDTSLEEQYKQVRLWLSAVVSQHSAGRLCTAGTNCCAGAGRFLLALSRPTMRAPCDSNSLQSCACCAGLSDQPLRGCLFTVLACLLLILALPACRSWPSPGSRPTLSSRARSRA